MTRQSESSAVTLMTVSISPLPGLYALGAFAIDPPVRIVVLMADGVVSGMDVQGPMLYAVTPDLTLAAQPGRSGLQVHAMLTAFPAPFWVGIRFLPDFNIVIEHRTSLSVLTCRVWPCRYTNHGRIPPTVWAVPGYAYHHRNVYGPM